MDRSEAQVKWVFGVNSGDARRTIDVVGAVAAPHGGDSASTLELSAQRDYLCHNSAVSRPYFGMFNQGLLNFL